MAQIVLKATKVNFSKSANRMDVHGCDALGAFVFPEQTIDSDDITQIFVSDGYDGQMNGRGVSIHTKSGPTYGLRRPLSDMLNDLSQARDLSDLMVFFYSKPAQARRVTTAQAYIMLHG